jgi:multidrug efflux pump subunit AcrA (membrane-fusion protein)
MTTRLRDKPLAMLLIAIASLSAWWSGKLEGVWQRFIPDRLYADPTASHRNPNDQSELNGNPAAQSSPLQLRTVHPVRDTNQIVVVSQPAEVAPYYLVQIYADTAGTIERIEPDLGDEVDREQTIAEIREPGSSTTTPIRSPIDGVIVSRSVDPGTFVANASVIPNATPIVTIAKLDTVTITMNVPDMFAPYVKEGMVAKIRNTNATKSPWIESKLTRISPVARVGDRTLAVEIDLFNQTRSEYDELMTDAKKTGFEEYKSRRAPDFPQNLSGEQTAGFTPGIIYEMQVHIDSLGQVPLLPSQCLTRRSGKPYVFLVENGSVVQVPVLVQFDNGSLCYAKPMRDINSSQQLSDDWDGTEEVIFDSRYDLQPGKSAVANPIERDVKSKKSRNP